MKKIIYLLLITILFSSFLLIKKWSVSNDALAVEFIECLVKHQYKVQQKKSLDYNKNGVGEFPLAKQVFQLSKEISNESSLIDEEIIDYRGYYFKVFIPISDKKFTSKNTEYKFHKAQEKLFIIYGWPKIFGWTGNIVLSSDHLTHCYSRSKEFSGLKKQPDYYTRYSGKKEFNINKLHLLNKQWFLVSK